MHIENGKVIFLDRRKEIREQLDKLNFEQTLEFWERLEKEFIAADLHEDFIRNMCLVDRFFLLSMIIIKDSADQEFFLHPWLFDRVREVERETDGVLDLWPRGHCKSTTITLAGSIQEIIKNPEITICIFSYSKATAKAFVDQVKKELEGNEILKNVFPDILYANPKRESPRWSVDKGIIVKRQNNPKEPTLMGSGVVDGQPTGMHYELRIYDDLVTAESVNTPEQIQKTTDMLSLSQNLGKATSSRAWYIGTRYSFGDTYQDMIDSGSVKVRRFKATEDGTIDGKPVFFSQEKWDKQIVEMNTNTIMCQMMQDPLGGGRRLFDIRKVGTYDVRPSMLNVYILVDPASSMKKGSDSTAMVVIGVDQGGRKFLLDGYHHKMSLVETWKNLKLLYNKWRIKDGVMNIAVGYERFGMQRDIEYFKQEMERSGEYFEITELAWPREGPAAKRDRMSRLDPDINSGKLLVPSLVHRAGQGTMMMRMNRDPKPGHDDEALFKKFDVEKVPDGHVMRKHPKLAVQPIRKSWTDGTDTKQYDLTIDFLTQAKSVPLGKHDDLVDAVSRIYDMDINTPQLIYSTLEKSYDDYDF